MTHAARRKSAQTRPAERVGGRYLFASLDAVPPEFYAKLKQAFGPLFDQAFRQGRALGDDNKLLGAILGELDGKWNQAGLESLGFSTRG